MLHLHARRRRPTRGGFIPGSAEWLANINKPTSAPSQVDLDRIAAQQKRQAEINAYAADSATRQQEETQHNARAQQIQANYQSQVQAQRAAQLDPYNQFRQSLGYETVDDFNEQQKQSWDYHKDNINYLTEAEKQEMLADNQSSVNNMVPAARRRLIEATQQIPGVPEHLQSRLNEMIMELPGEQLGGLYELTNALIDPVTNTFLNTKQKLTLLTQAMQDPKYVKQRLLEIRRISNREGVFFEQSDDTIRQTAGEEITDPGAVLRKDMEIYKEMTKPTGFNKFVADTFSFFDPIIDVLSPVIGLIPGIGPLISGVMDATQFAMQMATGADKAKEAERFNARYAQYAEPEEETGGSIGVMKDRRARKRKFKPILSGTKRMKWIKRTQPLHQAEAERGIA